eukprot:scaffold380500_cov34-Prasinocladus_malaysianus.AAC.1
MAASLTAEKPTYLPTLLWSFNVNLGSKHLNRMYAASRPTPVKLGHHYMKLYVKWSLPAATPFGCQQWKQAFEQAVRCQPDNPCNIWTAWPSLPEDLCEMFITCCLHS